MKNGKKLLLACLVTILLVAVASMAMAAPNPPPHTHNNGSWNNWVVQTPATCYQPGLRTRTCKTAGCLEIDSEVIPATGNHVYGDWETVDAATCTEGGTKIQYCTTLGCTASKPGTITKLGHDWGEWTTVNAATCTADGTQQQSCTRDGCTATNPGTITKLGHDWSDWDITLEPTCLEKGSKTRNCTRTGCEATETVAIDALGHDFTGPDKTAIEPTCTTTGLKAKVCPRCDAYRENGSKVIPMIPHSYTEWEETTAPTCTEEGVETEKCDVCEQLGKVTRPVEMLPHAYEWVETLAATCYAEGEETEICADCEAEGDVRPIAQRKHILESITQPATCQRNGLIHEYCLQPGCDYENDTLLPACDHPFEWVVVTKPTLSKKGLDKAVCSMCGLENGETRVTEPLGDVYANNTLSLAGARVKDINADVTKDWFMVTPIDLTKDGVTKIDIVVGNQYVIGQLVVTVKDGTVTFTLKMLPSVTMNNDAYLALFTGLDAINSLDEDEVPVYELNKAYSIADDLGGAETLYAFFFGTATYDRDADGVEYYVHDAKAANAILGK